MLRKKQVTENIQERSRKKVKFKKKVSLAVIVMMLVVSVAGCGKKKETAETTKATKNEEVTTTAEQTTGETAEGEFDFSQVFDNIEINGKKVPFPFTLNDLGEGYEFKNIVEMGDGTCGADLIYNCKEIAMVFVIADKKENVNELAQVIDLTIYDMYPEEITIDKITCSSSIIEVRKQFDNIKEGYNKEGEISLLYAEENGYSLYVSLVDNKISIIEIGKR